MSLLLAVIFLATGMLLASVAYMAPSHSPLGVHTPQAQQDNPIIDTQKRAFFFNGILAAIIVAALAVAAGGFAWVIVLLSFAQTAFTLWNLQHCARPIKEAKQSERWFAETETRISGAVAQPDSPLLDRLPSMSTAAVVYLLALLPLALAAGMVAGKYSEIPDVVATHWDGNMQADDWSQKGIGAVFFPSWIGVGMTIFFALISFSLPYFEVHNRKERGLAGWLKQRANTRHTAVGLAWSNFAMALGIAVLQVVLFLPKYEDARNSGMTAALIIMIGGAFVAVGWIFWGLKNFARTLSEAGILSGDSPDIDKHVKWGLFYYNPDDPAVLVEKQFGVGMDFNYARWQGKAFIATMLLLTVGCFVVLFL